MTATAAATGAAILTTELPFDCCLLSDGLSKVRFAFRGVMTAFLSNNMDKSYAWKPPSGLSTLAPPSGLVGTLVENLEMERDSYPPPIDS